MPQCSHALHLWVKILDYIEQGIVAVTLLSWTVAANAAELPLARVHFHHARVSYRPAVHFGYYCYQWGWRTGGTASSWYGSSFAFVGR